MISAGTQKALRFYQVLGLSGLLVMVGSLGGWAALSHIQGAVVATGTVMVESHAKRVQHRDGGIVAEIAVSEGDRVAAGDLLVRLDKTETRAELAIIESSLDELEAKRARLTAERDGAKAITFPEELLARRDEPAIAQMIAGQERLFESRMAALKGRKEQLVERIGQLEQEIAGLEAQMASKQEQSRLIEGELADLKQLLDKGLVPVSRVLALEREAARLVGDVGQLRTEKARTQSRIGETRLQIIQLEDDARSETLNELREAQARLAELRERRLEAHTQLSRTAIRAPRAGWVHQLTVHTIGGVVAAGETIMQIIPDLDELVIEARVRPQDIDEVSTGQNAIVRFTAFNQRTTLQATAEVMHVSADLRRPDDAPPFYAVRLRLPPDQMDVLGEVQLKPGMPAEVFIQTRSRTPLSYLLQPLSDQIARTFRES